MLTSAGRREQERGRGRPRSREGHPPREQLRGAPSNRLRSIRFEAATNARIDIGGQSRTAPFVYDVQGNPTELAFHIRRDANGAFTAPFVITDLCGETRSFAGAGSNVP